MRIMVTGGTGYIGAHTVQRLQSRGDWVLIVDDLATGHRGRVPGIPIIELDLSSPGASVLIARALVDHHIDAVIHFAARKRVNESVLRPEWYHQQNVGGVVELLTAMNQTGVDRLVFSSSAAVYGNASGAIDESAPLRPVSPYGETKLIGERLIEKAVASSALRAACLRYFNVGGAARPPLGDVERQNLIPIVLGKLDASEAPVIFGADFNTPDGTCIRDYVHVSDVAEAHLAVLDSLGDREASSRYVVFNVGTGIGTSVREMVQSLSVHVDSPLLPVVAGRRKGDAAEVVAIVDAIWKATGWRSRYSLRDIVLSSVAAHRFFARSISETDDHTSM